MTFKPMSIAKNTCPLDETHFMYRVMLSDYESGLTTNAILIQQAENMKFTASLNGNLEMSQQAKEIEKRANVNLSKVQKEYLGGFLVRLQANTIFENNKYSLSDINEMASEKLQQVEFEVTYEEYLTFVNGFDKMLGGETIYGEEYRKQYFRTQNYNSNFSVIPMTEQEEYLALYNLLQENIKEQTVTAETNGEVYINIELQEEAVNNLEVLYDYLESHKQGEVY